MNESYVESIMRSQCCRDDAVREESIV